MPKETVDTRPQLLLRPILSEGVEPPFMKDPYSVLIRAYSLSEDGRRRSILLPAGDSRNVSTQLQIEFPEGISMMLETPPGLWENKLETVDFKIDEETSELLIRLRSFRHDSTHLVHGTPIAILHFVNMVSVRLVE